MTVLPRRCLVCHQIVVPGTEVCQSCIVWAQDNRPGEHRFATLDLAVKGRCPSCGRKSLFVGFGGHVTCRADVCPAPWAADDLLNEEAPA